MFALSNLFLPTLDAVHHQQVQYFARAADLARRACEQVKHESQSRRAFSRGLDIGLLSLINKCNIAV